MKIIKDVVFLGGKGIHCVVLRNITELYWLKVIETTENNRVCALGTPGIGKSFSACIVIRLLLQDKKTVVYHRRTVDKDGLVYIFSPSMTSLDIDVRVIQESNFKKREKSIHNESTYYVVDPERTKDTCDPDKDYKGNVIIVASPDEGHWGASEFDKRRLGKAGQFLYYPVWDEWELVCAGPFMNSEIKEEEIRKRFLRFGGVPRYIFESNLLRAESKQQIALKKVNAQTVLDLVFEERSILETSARDFPNGILLAYKLCESDNGKFTDYYTELASDYLYEDIAYKFMNVLWNRISSSEGTFDPYLFEAYCRCLIHGILHSNATKTFTMKVAKGKKKEETNLEQNVVLPCTSLVERVEDIVASAKANALCLYYPTSKKQKLIDFMYRQNDVYNMFQATIGLKHEANPAHIVEFSLCLIRGRHDWLLDGVDNDERTLPKINFYYMVPDFRFATFVTDPVDPSWDAKNLFAIQECNHILGKDTMLYEKWNDIVGVNILKVLQPQDSSMKIDTREIETD
jgi:hypothetical protein